MHLYELSAQYNKSFLELADSDFDAETINDTLEAMEGEVAVKGANVLAFALNLDVEANAIKEVEKRLELRRKSIEKKSEWMKEYLKSNMARTGITEIEAIDGTFKATLSIGRDKALVIDEQGKIPCDYFTVIPEHVVPEAWELNKSDVKKALLDGVQIEGAHIEYRDRLTIK